MNTTTIGSHYCPTSLWRKLMWSGAIALLLAPAVAMQFSAEVNWTPADFIVFGTMLAIAGGTVEIAARASRDQAYLIATVIAVGAGFLMVWANLAVGIIGSENNPANLIFFAEKDQVGYHAQSPFNLATGKAIPSSKPKPPGYSKVFAHTLVKLAENNPKILGITAAMATGTGLDKLQAKLPKQYIDVGIAEQHAVTLAAGLACEGMRPVVAIYSTFLQRAYDQIVHDVCIQNLPVFFCLDRAGIVGADGPTHQGMYDIAYLRCLPNLVIMAPKDEAELQQMLVTGINHTDGPIAMRYPRGSGYGVPLMEEGWEPLPIGKGEILRNGDDLLLIGYGSMVYSAMQVAEILSEHGIESTVINARFVKPLDTELILPLAQRIGKVATLEEGCVMGGFGSAVAEALMDNNVLVPLKRFGIPDQLVDHAKPDEYKVDLGLTTSQLSEQIRDACFSKQPSTVS